MIFSNKKIWILTDGSQGMVSQVLGLAQNLSNDINIINTKLHFPWSKLQPGILPIFSWIFINELNFSLKPDIVISCGRKSVYLSLFIKKKIKNVITIHIQNPKINPRYFNYIVSPNHDSLIGKNIINSKGAIHKFTKEIINKEKDSKFKLPKDNLVSVIIGGTNNHYNFSNREISDLILKIKNLKKQNPKFNFLIISSRRTSYEIKSLINKELNKISIVWNEKDENPYVFSLKYSKYFIVTSDSTSMISECTITDKPIYVYHLPFKRFSKRIYNFHKEFENLHFTKKLTEKSELIAWNYDSINEAERIAGIIKERILNK